ncbi:MAG TPA: ATP-dependent Clp protease proteolytic subunit [Deinococcales bacterium]|nr:ATP-dependent Clp protease proteolytic subunit [Deinococcales bacterium]
MTESFAYPIGAVQQVSGPQLSSGRTDPLTKAHIKEVHERALDFGHLLIGSKIDEDSLYTVYHTLSQMIERKSRQAQPDPIRVTINSPGGDAFLGLTIAKMLAESPVPIHTKVVGVAASAAAIIFLGGQVRSIAPGSRIMFHDSWVHTYSATAEHNRRQAALHESLDREMAEFIAARAGLPLDLVERENSKDHWYMDRAKALELGVANDAPRPGVQAAATADPIVRQLESAAVVSAPASVEPAAPASSLAAAQAGD